MRVECFRERVECFFVQYLRGTWVGRGEGGLFVYVFGEGCKGHRRCMYATHTPHIRHAYASHTPHIHHTYATHREGTALIQNTCCPPERKVALWRGPGASHTTHTLCMCYAYTTHTLPILHTYATHMLPICHTYTTQMLHTPSGCWIQC